MQRSERKGGKKKGSSRSSCGNVLIYDRGDLWGKVFSHAQEGEEKKCAPFSIQGTRLLGESGCANPLYLKKRRYKALLRRGRRKKDS